MMDVPELLAACTPRTLPSRRRLARLAGDAARVHDRLAESIDPQDRDPQTRRALADLHSIAQELARLARG